MCDAATFVGRKRRTTQKCCNLYSTVKTLMTRDGPAVIDTKARYWSKTAIFASVKGFPSEYCHNVWYEKKTEWCGYPTVKKIEDMFISFDRIQERDGRADRRT